MGALVDCPAGAAGGVLGAEEQPTNAIARMTKPNPMNFFISYLAYHQGFFDDLFRFQR